MAKSRAVRDRVQSLKEATPCTDCGISYPYVVMQFDHVRGDKVANVSRLVARLAAWHRIEAEIAKCELVCANCHALRTHRRLDMEGPAG